MRITVKPLGSTDHTAATNCPLRVFYSSDMSPTPNRCSIASAALPLLLAVLMFIPGITWGLPSRAVDSALFGGRTPWTGAEILGHLQSTDQPSVRGADVDSSPIIDRSIPLYINESDAQRAAIVQRYRLMSAQPDEFIQFKALAEMAGRSGVDRLDPRLYQYGGVWIYPVGGLLKLGSMLGVIDLRADRAYYLDHPEAFARFYIIARAYSAAWGVVAVLAVGWIVRRMTADATCGFLAACSFAVLPVVVNAAHEAKPHLAGAALCLLSIIAATKHIETRRSSYAIFAAIFAGLAVGAVLSMLWAMAVVPVMVWLAARSHKGESNASAAARPWRRRAIALLLLAAATYALTNPFAIFNALFRPEIPGSNLGNSSAMYAVGNVARSVLKTPILLAHAMTPWVLVGGVLGTIALSIRWLTRQAGCKSAGSGTPARLLAVPAILVLVQFALLIDTKPAEYARFSIVLGAAAIVAFFAAAHALVGPHLRRLWLIAIALLVATNAATIFLTARIIADRESERFAIMSDRLEQLGQTSLAIVYEPAPWSLPPMNLFDRQLILVRDRQMFRDESSSTALVYPSNLSSQIDRTDRQLFWPPSESMFWPLSRPIFETLPNATSQPAD